MFRFAWLATCLSLALEIGTAQAQEGEPPADLAALDRALAQRFADDGVPGASVAVIEDGEIVLAKGYGFADVAAKRPATADTPFRAGSISKSVTAVALMTLVEQGKLSLDARVAEAAPDVAFENPWEATQPLRLVHLVEHTAGWPDIGTRVLAKDEPGWTVGQGVRFMSADFVSRWAPGRFTSYCNAGAAVVGVAIERAAGQPFDDFARSAVLRPLGMARADFAATAEVASEVARSYAGDGSETPFQHIVARPAGSLSVSARELAQLARFYLGRGSVDGRRVLAPESVARIERSETNLASALGFVDGYGLGVAPLPDAGVTFRGHNGSIDSFTSVLAYSARANAGYVLMANGGAGVDFASPAAQLVQRYLTRALPMAPPPAVAVSEGELARYAGFYRNLTAPNALLRPYAEMLGWARVTRDGGSLQRSGRALIPVAPGLFRRADREAPTVAFVEEGGQVYALTAFNASVREPAWKPLGAFAVGVLLALGAVGGLVMLVPWSIATARGRLAARGGPALRFVPFAGVVALAVTLGVPIALFLGSPTSARPLAEVGAWSLLVFVASGLVPVLGVAGLALAQRRAEAGRAVRGLAAATSLALLAASAYLVTIGWIGARTWAM